MNGLFNRVLKKNTLVFGGIVIYFFMLLFLWMTQKAESHGFYKEKPKLTEKLFQRGQALYQKQCSVCHGHQGSADGKAAYLLYPKPRDFVGDKFRLISTTNQQATDADLFEVISRGMAGSSMPPWEHLSERDRWALVYYVRYLSEVDDYIKTGDISEEMIQKGLSWEWIQKIVNKKMDSADVIKIPEEPKVTPEALNRGRELFVASCAGCHGVQGKGDGQQNMVDSQGLPTKPRDLTAGIFKADSSSEELYFRMMGGMPGTPMPSYDGVFTQEQIWDLIHFVQSLVPSGVEEKTRLKHTRITAQKISGEIEMNPFAEQWSSIEPVYVALTPLWWRNDRVEGVEVKALHNKEGIAFYLSWGDGSKEDDVVAVQSFSDGAALQFSAEKDPPFFGMGSKDNPVYIWHWKAGWQETGEERKDIETRYPHTASDWYLAQKNYQHGSPFETRESKTYFHDPQFITGWGAKNPLSDPHRKVAEEASSEGLGSYTTQIPKVEEVQAKGIWQEGKWHVVFSRPLKSSEKGTLQFKQGLSLSIAFAIWDGAGKDRDGQKMVSIWNDLILER